MRISWTRQAENDLDQVEAYISQDNPAAAVETVLHIIDTVERTLAIFPNLGREGRVGSIREYVIPGLPYTVAYTVLKNELIILSIIHGARRWPDNFDNA